MLYKAYTLAVVAAYYPIYLSILAVDKIKQKLNLDQFVAKEFVTYVAATAIGLACLGLLALVIARDTIKEMDIGSSDQR